MLYASSFDIAFDVFVIFLLDGSCRKYFFALVDVIEVQKEAPASLEWTLSVLHCQADKS